MLTCKNIYNGIMIIWLLPSRVKVDFLSNNSILAVKWTIPAMHSTAGLPQRLESNIASFDNSCSQLSRHIKVFVDYCDFRIFSLNLSTCRDSLNKDCFWVGLYYCCYYSHLYFMWPLCLHAQTVQRELWTVRLGKKPHRVEYFTLYQEWNHGSTSLEDR